MGMHDQQILLLDANPPQGSLLLLSHNAFHPQPVLVRSHPLPRRHETCSIDDGIQLLWTELYMLRHAHPFSLLDGKHCIALGDSLDVEISKGLGTNTQDRTE